MFWIIAAFMISQLLLLQMLVMKVTKRCVLVLTQLQLVPEQLF